MGTQRRQSQLYTSGLEPTSRKSASTIIFVHHVSSVSDDVRDPIYDPTAVLVQLWLTVTVLTRHGQEQGICYTDGYSLVQEIRNLHSLRGPPGCV